MTLQTHCTMNTEQTSENIFTYIKYNQYKKSDKAPFIV